MNEDSAEIKGFFRGLVWGILLILGFIFFLGTDRGRQLKKKLKEEGEGMLGEIPALLDKLEEKSEELVEEAAKIEEELKEKTHEVGENLTEETERKLDASLSHIEALQEHGREITSGFKKHFFKNIPKKNKKTAGN